MLKHNIDSLLGGKKPSYGFRHLGVPSGRIGESERLLAAILGDHFFVQVIWVPVWRPLEGKRGSVLEVCGSPDNLELAEYAHAFVMQTAERLWQDFQRARSTRGRSDRQRFLSGVMSGFRDRLERDRKKNGAEGLVWKGDGDLHGFFRRRHPHIASRATPPTRGAKPTAAVAPRVRSSCSIEASARARPQLTPASCRRNAEGRASGSKRTRGLADHPGRALCSVAMLPGAPEGLRRPFRRAGRREARAPLAGLP